MNQDLKKTLWAAADKLRSSMDAAEYKHIVLGLIFVKYISDAFDERRAQLQTAFQTESGDLHLPDAADHALKIERSRGTGGLWATNPKTGERLKGQYTGRYEDGGSSTAEVRNNATGATGTVNTYSPPTSANARGYLRGDKGTVIDVYLDITPGIIPRGTGEGIDNKGNRYRVSF